MNYLFVPFAFLLSLSLANAEQTDPYAIYLKYYQTIGGLEALKKIKTTYTEGQQTVDHLNGTFKGWTKYPIQYRSEENFNIFKQYSGDNGRQAWDQDFNGNVVLIKDEESLKRRKISLLVSDYQHINRDSRHFSLSYQGKAEINQTPVHIVKMSNDINKDIILHYFDIDHFLLLKTVKKQGDIETHSLYKNYRQADGNIMMAFRIESEVKPRNKHETIIISKFQANPEIPENYFSIPAENHKSISFKEDAVEESIPFTLSDNLIYLPVQLKGKESLWIVDSGASHSVIDEDYAKQLGLTIHPGIKGFGFGGTFDLSYVKLPSYGPKNVQLENQTVYALKGLSQRFSSPKAVGILGYDFLSRFIVKIDYAKQHLVLYQHHGFNYTGSGSVINAPLKNNTFSLPVILDNKLQANWAIDLGAYDVSIHYPYAKKNNLLQRKGLETISAGIDGILLERTIKFDSLSIGPYSIQPAYINVAVNKGSGSGGDGELAGNLGNSVLGRFVLYLDYKNQQIILEPGENFNKVRPQNLTGVTLSYSDEDQLPFIAHISPDSPAMKADFEPGDDIVAINGLSTTEIGELAQVQNYFLTPGCETMQLIIKHKGVLHTTELECY